MEAYGVMKADASNHSNKFILRFSLSLFSHGGKSIEYLRYFTKSRSRSISLSVSLPFCSVLLCPRSVPPRSKGWIGSSSRHRFPRFSDMGFALGVVSKMKRIFSSPAKEKSPNGANPWVDPAPRAKIVDTGYEFRVKDFGSKEETFFDSRVWLDSDCEDDYCSVKGEFTPSRGSTPNRQFGGLGTPQRNGKAAAFDDLFPDTKSEPSPTEKKKKLAELLQDSLCEQAGGVLNSGDGKVDGFGKSDLGVNGKPATYEVEMNQDQASSEGTPKPRKERTGMAAACCMSGLVRGVISRKQKMSPAR